FEEGGVQPALLQEVGRSGLHRREIDFPDVLAGEQDDRAAETAALAGLGEEVEARLLPEPEVEQVDVVLAPAHGRQAGVVVGYPVQPVPAAGDLGEQVAGEQ